MANYVSKHTGAQIDAAVENVGVLDGKVTTLSEEKVSSVNGFLPDSEGAVTIKYEATSELTYRHSDLSKYPKRITVFANDSYANNPYIFLGKNYWPTATYTNIGFDKYGLTYKTDGHNISVEGTATVGSSFTLTDDELNTKWMLPSDLSVGDVLRIYLFGKQSDNSSPFVKVELYDDTGSRIAYTQVTLAAGTIYSRSGTLTIPEGVAYVNFKVSFNKDNTYDNTIFPVLVKEGTTIINDQAFADGVVVVETDDETLDICSAPYNSVVNYALELKRYIDSQRSNVDFIMAEIDKWKSFVSPEMFGAYADGQHDDTAAVQACIDYAIANQIRMIGGSTYITSEPLVITGNRLYVDIKEIDYKGSDCAVIVNGSYNKINVGCIFASNGAGFRVNSEITSSFNHYYIGRIYSNGNCVEYIVTLSSIVGNSLTFGELQSKGGANCIYNSPQSTLAVGEKWNGNNNFIGGKLAAGEWGVYNAHGEDSYITCQFEGVKNGIRMMGVGNCRVIAPRYTELIQTAFDRGEVGHPMIEGQGVFLKIVSPTSTWVTGDSTRMSIELAPSGGYLFESSVDLSEVPLEYVYKNGNVIGIAKDTDAHVINVPIKSRTGTALGNSFLIFGRHILIKTPVFAKVRHVQTSTHGYAGDYRETGTDEEFKIYSKFIIDENGCDYTLPPSYDIVAFDKFEIEQPEGCYATFRDWRGTVIFDGATYGAGLYELQAYKRDNSNWDTYENSNQMWVVRKVSNDVVATMPQVTE